MVSPKVCMDLEVVSKDVLENDKALSLYKGAQPCMPPGERSRELGFPIHASVFQEESKSVGLLYGSHMLPHLMLYFRHLLTAQGDHLILNGCGERLFFMNGLEVDNGYWAWNWA